MTDHERQPEYEVFAVDTALVPLYKVLGALDLAAPTGLVGLDRDAFFRVLRITAAPAAVRNLNQAVSAWSRLHDEAHNFCWEWFETQEERDQHEDELEEFRQHAVWLLEYLDRIPGLLEAAQPGELYYMLNEHRDALKPYKWAEESWASDLVHRAWMEDPDWVIDMIHDRVPLKALWATTGFTVTVMENGRDNSPVPGKGNNIEEHE